MTKTAIYCRLSKEDEQLKDNARSESIENQKNILLCYAKQQNWTVFDIYIDEDYSGADRSRPEFCRLIHDCCMGKIEIVLSKSLSRFSREISVIEDYVHTLFPRLGIRFVSVSDGMDTKDKGNKKARQINSLLNEWYLEDISVNVRTVLDFKRQRGDHIGSFALYGYKKDADNKLSIDETAAKTVRRIFSSKNIGMCAREIAEMLNTDAVPTPSQYKAFYHPSYSGKMLPAWTEDAVRRILKNEMYTGVLIQGRYKKESFKTKKLIHLREEDWIKVPNAIPKIVEPEEWVNAQTKGCHRTVIQDPLREKLRCGCCGQTLSRNTVRGYLYYRCPKGCKRISVREDEISRIIQRQTELLSIKMQDRYYDEKPKEDILKTLEIACRNNVADEVIQSLQSKLEKLQLVHCDDYMVDGVLLIDQITVSVTNTAEKKIDIYWKFCN